MAAQDQDRSSTRTERRIPLAVRLVLFASLALNLVIVGIVAGFIIRGGPSDRPPRHLRDVVAPYTAALSPDARREIGRKLGRASRGDREARTQVRGEYAEALGLLRADPFDRAAFEVLLTRQSARAATRQKQGQVLLLEHITAMSPTGRQAYAGRVEEALKRFGRKRR